MQESVKGIVHKIVFQNAENGYCVLRIRARGVREVVTLTGHASTINEGENLEAEGTWVIDKKYGLQFKAEALRTKPPSTVAGIKKYLSSGMIRGIGEVYAKKLLDHFGEDIFNVIEESPHLLGEVEGIGKKRARMIIDSWQEQKAVQDIMIFLHEHGISTARAVRIYKEYGKHAVAVIKDNPYRLARDIRGIGFKSADEVAANIGIAKDAPIRARAGLSHVLFEAAASGNCGLPLEDLVEKTKELLGIEEDIIKRGLQGELADNELVLEQIDEQDAVFAKKLAIAERESAKKLLELASCAAPPWGKIDAKGAISKVEVEVGIEFSQSQKNAIEKALKEKLLIITGGPGSGKTTLLNAILKIIDEQADIKILLAAPTGRAAKRMSEATGRAASTIHRLLGQYLYSYEQGENLKCDLLVLDEASMVDVPLMFALLRQIPKASAVFIVGDTDQLPSVGAGNVLGDMIASNKLPLITLTEIFRQAEASAIITNCHLVNKGKMPMIENNDAEKDFFFIAADTDERIAEISVDLAKNRLPRKFGVNPKEDIQILTPMTRGVLGTRSLNIMLQNSLNPNQHGKIESFGTKFSVGDKVMQITNNYDKKVFNGDIGFIHSLSTEEKSLIINYEGRGVEYAQAELDEVTLAYAITIHKSQGSEYPIIIIPFSTSHYAMLQRNLLYTAISRGRKLVIIVGKKQAIEMAVSREGGKKRYSLLKKYLEDFS